MKTNQIIIHEPSDIQTLACSKIIKIDTETNSPRFKVDAAVH